MFCLRMRTCLYFTDAAGFIQKPLRSSCQGNVEEVEISLLATMTESFHSDNASCLSSAMVRGKEDFMHVIRIFYKASRAQLRTWQALTLQSTSVTGGEGNRALRQLAD